MKRGYRRGAIKAPLTRQQFVMDEPFVKAFSVEEVNATWDDMAEMGINRFPFLDLDIIMPAILVMKPREATYKSPEEVQDAWESIRRWRIKFKFTNEAQDDWFLERVDRSWFPLDEAYMESGRADELTDRKPEAFEGARRLLVVALATKNIEKDIRINKAARLGIGKASREGIASVTYLRVGKVTETPGGLPVGTHQSPRPHLRRGHIRRQRYGTGFQLEKTVWIAPVFVNADEKFIESRKEYRLIERE